MSTEEHLEAHLDVISKGPSHFFAPEMSNTTLTEQLIRVAIDFAPLNGICRSVDLSCAPEASFVPETEFFSDTLSSGDVDNTAETAHIKINLPMKSIDLNLSLSELHENPIFTKTQSDAVTNSVRGMEGMIDSHMNGAETALTNYEFTVRGFDLNASPSGSYEIPFMLKNHSDTNTIPEPFQEVADPHVECVREFPKEYNVTDECSHEFQCEIQVQELSQFLGGL